MPTKVVVHSTAMRLIQVVALAIAFASFLIGIRYLRRELRSDVTPVAALNPTESSQGLIVGPARVIDGDTIEIGRSRIRLEGIDSPELGQPCEHAGTTWQCGEDAATALRNHLNGQSLTCRVKGSDRYGRTLSRCFMGGEDIQSWLVVEGWALAYRRYSMDYVPAEDVARQRSSGLWKGTFEQPWAWRGKSKSRPY